MAPTPPFLFSLRPYKGNTKAEAVIAHDANRHLLSTLEDGTPVLTISSCFRSRSGSGSTLATIGRSETDIHISYAWISRTQCSFEISLDSNAIMLYDRSHSQSTKLQGENAMPFEPGHHRQVVVQQGLNTVIGMGSDLILFELLWHHDPVETMSIVKNRECVPYGFGGHPYLTRTQPASPLSMEGRRRLRVRYVTIGRQPESRQFETVHKAVNVDSGKLMLVRILHGEPKVPSYDTLRREVDFLSNHGHLHIVEFIASQGWEGQCVEIFMGLNEATLGSLVKSGSCTEAVAVSAFDHMLQALDFLACNDIVHRDVKPENIFYLSLSNNKHLFRLGNPGLYSHTNTLSDTGTQMYMAPETLRGEEQTHKGDVWSLFVTVMWAQDVKDFRQNQSQLTLNEIREAVLYAASNEEGVSGYKEMAIINPEERASAAQMLVKCFGGKGLSTPRQNVPALPNSSAIAAATASAAVPVPALSAATTQITPSNREDLQDTDMQDTDVQGTDMQDTDMQDTDMQDTDMQATGMQATDMQATDISVAATRDRYLRSQPPRQAKASAKRAQSSGRERASDAWRVSKRSHQHLGKNAREARPA
ncbi:hypothetical protein GP486_000445 [Trichoglossum hirsutum]|uniref:non-specific serine/threonine protein kinase n=1 Tax=Trichoglossum hirsutum TaxID=265104 RepID=A0A9P8RU16_9PEZI|nr:hypothetical protein GP486_000445 [Trichoglossum hirsutum]